MMKIKYWVLVLIMTVSVNAFSELIWTIEGVGNDVVISTAGGALDFTGLTKSTYNIPGDLSNFDTSWVRLNTVAPDAVTLDYYASDQWSFSKDWDSYYEKVADSITGESYFFQDNMLCVPLGYESGNLLGAASMTFANTSLTDMGLNEGESASWTWAADSVSVVVGAVPEPATISMMGIIAGLGLLIRRRFMS